MYLFDTDDLVTMTEHDRLGVVIEICLAVVVGVVLLCSMVIPVVSGQLDLLSSDEMTKYGSLISVVIIMTIVSLIIFVVKRMNNGLR